MSLRGCKSDEPRKDARQKQVEASVATRDAVDSLDEELLYSSYMTGRQKIV